MAVFNNVLAGAAGQGGAAYSIERSLRFNADDNAYLTRDPDTQGTRTTWTWSAWVKFSSVDRKVLFAGVTNEANRYFFIEHDGNGYLNIIDLTFSTTNSRLRTSRQFKDYSAWYHIVFTYDTTNSTADDRHRLYVNGEQIEDFINRTNPAANHSSHVLSLHPHYLSGYTSTGTLPHDGYMAEVYLIDGQSLQASDFGEYDSNNVWQPKKYEGTYGTHGWHLDFSDATNTTTIAEDSSGNGNDWTANNISVTAGSGNDSLFDSPLNGTQSDTGAGGEVSGNYCTFNNAIPSANTTNNGALDFAASSGWESVFGTMLIPSSGKWYFELTAGGANNMAGIVEASSDLDPSNFPGVVSTSYMYNFGSGKKIEGPNNTQTAYGATGAAADVIGVALDMDGGTLTFYKNGTSQGTAFSSLTGSYIPVVAAYQGSGTAVANFGQRPFAYSAPSGYKCLCSANLPDPTIADGSTGMDVVLYSGNSSTQTISGLNFSPDLVWIKSRTQSRDHKLVDSVRGVGEELEPNQTTAEVTNSDGLTAFNSDGFSLGADADYNIGFGNTYVAWAWDAGSSTVSNTDGSTTANVRANASTGCSIVSYTGTSANATIGHGLNAAPEFVLIKNRDRAIDWIVYHASLGATKYLELNTGDAAGTISSYFNNTAPTSSVVSIGAAVAVNYTGEDIIAYCFAPVEGYSAFSSYEGNGSTDGPFVYTGFQPKWILIKCTTASNHWTLIDTERDGYNPETDPLLANENLAESTGNIADIVSNGFKITSISGTVNTSGETYAVIAFAAHPFKTSRAR